MLLALDFDVTESVHMSINSTDVTCFNSETDLREAVPRESHIDVERVFRVLGEYVFQRVRFAEFRLDEEHRSLSVLARGLSLGVCVHTHTREQRRRCR